jgi:two-component system, cell cycle response regulator
MRILIADDSIVSRHLLEATLRKWGYEVTVSTDGDQAWQHLQGDNPPPIAILDWVMPGMSGLDVCRRLRVQQGQEPYTYVMLLTSKNQREDLIEGMEAGADDYITKPFDQHELQVRLRAGRRIVELQDELRRQATHDALTGVLNRSKTFEIFTRELQRSKREGTPLGAILVDLDHFKSVNDTYGHLAGDEVLRNAAARLQSSIRSYDAVGRYGGEEFIVLLPGCDEATACAQAERLRLALSMDPVVLDSASSVEYQLTASFGVAVSQPSRQAASPETLVAAADEALYKAKRGGRNRVELLPLPAPAALQDAAEELFVG